MPRITPHLWFNQQGEEAAAFYISIFPNSKAGQIVRYNEATAEAAKRPVDSVMTIEFELDGQAFTALNGGPMFQFNESISFIVDCKDQAEVDYYWEALGAGGEYQYCGWLKDKFGVSWQIVPIQLAGLMTVADPERLARVTAVLMDMVKIDIAVLLRAYDGHG